MPYSSTHYVALITYRSKKKQERWPLGKRKIIAARDIKKNHIERMKLTIWVASSSLSCSPCQAAIWNYNGSQKEVIGPALVRMFFSTIRFMDQHIACLEEYLVIRFKDGHVEHIRGPAALYQNPVFHEKVTVVKAIHLNTASEALVVYREVFPGLPIHNNSSTSSSSTLKDDDFKKAVPPAMRGKLERVIITGPTVYFPEVGEIIHDFRWSGFDERGHFVAGIDEFRIIGLNIKKWSVGIACRTSDGAQVLIKLAIRIGIKGVDQVGAVLDASDDPIGDLYSAIQADIGQVCSSVKGTDFQSGKP